MSRPLRIVAALTAVSLGAPAGAAAQEDGVFVDPDAPATTEYVLPLEAARQESTTGAATRKGQKAGERSAPLFGAGVTSDGASQDAGAAPAVKREKPVEITQDATGRIKIKPVAPVATADQGLSDPAVQRAVAEIPAGGDGTVTMAVGGAAVLALALAGGLLLRRRDEGESA